MTATNSDVSGSPFPIGAVQLDHVSLRVPDYAASVHWYRTVLGLPLILEWTDPDLPGLRFCHLRLGTTALELIGGGEPDERPVVRTVADHLRPAGVVHLCLTVASLKDAADALAAHGIEPLAGPLHVEALGITLLVIRDNSGNVLEISERD